MQFNGSQLDKLGVLFNVGISNPFVSENDDGQPIPPPPEKFIAINEDNLNIITVSTGNLLITN
jgi:hypothetical protein